MYKYINKIPVRQTNFFYKQLGLTYNLMGQDKDISSHFHSSSTKPSLDCTRSNRLRGTPISYQNLNQIRKHAPTSSHASRALIHRQYSNPKQSYGDSNILKKYYRLTATKSSFSTLSGRVSKKSCKTCHQIRGYPGLLRRILGFLRGKPAKSKKPMAKCEKVSLDCPPKTSPKAEDCLKIPPPNINFETATECKEETVKTNVEEVEIVCPQKVEVDHKEKPPFQCEGGQFLEDRLCKEMPDKRCERLIEEHDLKQEKQRDIEEIKENEKRLLKDDGLKICIKSKKKEKVKTCIEDNIGLDISEEKSKKVCGNPVRELDCAVASVKEKCKVKVKECKIPKLKVDCPPLKANVKEECQKDKCGNAKPCQKAEKMKMKTCAELKSKNVEKDKCRNVKACATKKKNDDSKKPPKDGCGTADSGGTPKSCGGSSKCEDVNFSSTQEEKALIPLLQNDNLPSTESISVNDALQEVIIKSPESKIFTASGNFRSDQVEVLTAYSTVIIKLSNTNVISVNLSAAEHENISMNLSNINYQRRLLEPFPSIARPFQTRDSRNTALSRLDLSKLVISPHVIGKTPTLTSIDKQFHILAAYISNKERKKSCSSSLPNVFNMNTPHQLFFSKMSALPPAQLDPRRVIEQKDPRKIIELKDPGKVIEVKEPTAVAAIKENTVCNRIEEPFRKESMYLSDADANKSNSNNNDNNKDEKCKEEKPTCPSPQSCCKQDKNKCDTPAEQLRKELPPCKPARSCERREATTPCEKKQKKQEMCFDPKAAVKLCNFDQGVKVEKKVKEKELCSRVFREDDCCPKKKQLCCYQKKEKPKMPVDSCCKYQHFAIKGVDCPLCKKFEILDLPPKPKPKPSVCKAKKCGSPKDVCQANTSSVTSCKKLPKRPNFCCPKCPKPKFKEDPPKEKKKEPVGIGRCTKAPCYQKKCGKKKPPPPPCPAPVVKPPKVEKELCPPTPCKKTAASVIDAATQKRLEKMCAKPSNRRDKSMKCNKGISDCDKKKDKKTLEREEREQREKEARERAYAELKHTEWKAVPIQGNHKWCTQQPVVKDDKCKEELSKTVLPSREEKYQSPRYKQEDKPKPNCPSKPCSKKTQNKKNVRKMSSCPSLEDKPVYKIPKASTCVNFENEFIKIMNSGRRNDHTKNKK